MYWSIVQVYIDIQFTVPGIIYFLPMILLPWKRQPSTIPNSKSKNAQDRSFDIKHILFHVPCFFVFFFVHQLGKQMFLWLKQKKYFDILQEILLENRENHRPSTSHWQTISHNAVSSTTPHHEGIDNCSGGGLLGTDYIYIYINLTTVRSHPR
jgi:hypothetical protein